MVHINHSSYQMFSRTLMAKKVRFLFYAHNCSSSLCLMQSNTLAMLLSIITKPSIQSRIHNAPMTPVRQADYPV